ncbi:MULTISPECIES: PIN/TRAM domain-containing protein [unclassified Enterococcus]|uniref:PIN/TRAM domain-containing protein n=1 Tax=unclassified Enterococcus TaxID=2608891 RepID=UPI0015579216|nr:MULTISPECIES: PIN/TRAM domain-containing protein [unclassified Enterococcus]MBS7578211.1 PIN/TRAM domain-containing protein [Enterococcus sp. MMGLQ5-2]MBS7585413.1 PIN/TRAM domain-containing protein [Enterococcus sp. MMGLQ5-1]NPD13270.1 PIN/TRAM domain-containing protein [Enterococcus sp. MMGLQ5-1]NPD38042.1 PIN/TRAM domain-containing protein [Enterococcus sp. MMGLQ5-2]
MRKNIIHLLMVIIGASLGGSFLPAFWLAIQQRDSVFNRPIVNSIIGGVIFLILSLFLANFILKLLTAIDERASKISLTEVLFASIGSVMGLLIGLLGSIPLFYLNVPFVSTVLPFVIMILLAYTGFSIFHRRQEDIRQLLIKNRKVTIEEAPKVMERRADEQFHHYKLLDTSVLIDGRILDILRTGFIEGTILVPNFVLLELQLVADSTDSLKRAKGRRGLDILNILQKEEAIDIEMYDLDYEDIKEVDTKLMKLARHLDAILITNDYNLNKIAEFQNITVLNINELANAVKPVVIPGEEMEVTVVKAGTEREQGVAYLEDGTMIVVEEGQRHMNQPISVVVTTALQTAAGRMIFAKPNKKRLEHQKSTR